MLRISSCPVCQSDRLSSYIQVEAQMHPSKEKFNYDQCASCQLVMLNPRVAIGELKNYYTDYYLPYRGSNAWGKYRALVEMGFKQTDRKRVEVLRSFQALNEKTTILDIGCGKPSFLHAAYKKYGVKGIGLDFADTGWCDELIYQRDLNLREGEVAQLKLDVQPDFVTMWHYLEHDYDPNDTLRKVRQLSGENTHLIIEVPNFDSKSRKEYGEYWAGWHTPRHTFLFSPDNLAQLLENTGWEVKEIRTQGTLSDYLLYWMSEMERQGINWEESMEHKFQKFAFNQMKLQMSSLFKAKQSHGIMLAIAVPSS